MSSIVIGRHNILRVLRETEPGLYLGDEEEQILMPWRYVAEGTKVGQELRVFVYTDSEDRPIATTLTPTAEVGDFAFLEVVDVNNAGAFLNWGLAKDLVAPFNEQVRKLEVGDWQVFAVTSDAPLAPDGKPDASRTRVKACSQLARYLDYDVDEVKVDDEVDLLVYGHTPIGTLVVVDGRHAGLVYRDETFKRLRVGDELKGFVKAVREDNKLDIRLQRVGQGAADDAQAVILTALAEAGGFLPLHDKSPPEAIRKRLALSKKVFKRALGALYKTNQVALKQDGIALHEDKPSP